MPLGSKLLPVSASLVLALAWLNHCAAQSPGKNDKAEKSERAATSQAERKELERVRGRLEKLGPRFVAPPIRLCTDNGAMIAWAGLERLRLGLTDPLDFKPRPRWPLDEVRSAA